jgi:ElaB/YqjD/DUF883 family membrane-anchored ribosome-binding protein
MADEASDIYQDIEAPKEVKASKMNQDIEGLKEDVRRLRQDLAALTESVKKVAHGGAEVGRARAHDELERLYEQFQETYDSVRKESSRARTGLEKEIGERPFTTLLGAFVVGIVLGKFMSAH